MNIKRKKVTKKAIPVQSKFSPEQETILKTLAYSQVFDFPLTVEELYTRQMRSPLHETISLLKIKQLVKASLVVVVTTDSLIAFKQKNKTIELRKQRLRWSKEKWSEIDEIKKILRFVPFIQEAYITGALAVNNLSSLNDDIDLLIISKKNRLWITRSVAVLFAILKGKYRFHHSKKQTGWCFNLWLDEAHLELPEERRSLYSAYEVIQSKQFIGNKNMLLRANAWVKDFLPSMTPSLQYTPIQDSSSGIMTIFNQVLYFFQWQIMKKRHTIEKVGIGYAFFHPRNTQRNVMTEYRKLLQELGIQE